MKMKRIFFDILQIEKFLNRMSEKGYHFISLKGITYLFEEQNDITYSYLIERLQTSNQKSDDPKIELIFSLNHWGYFRKNRQDGPFERIDRSPLIQFYSQLLPLYFFIVLINLIGGVNNQVQLLIFQRPIDSLNLTVGIINFLIVILFTPFLFHYYQLIQTLKREQRNNSNND